MRTVSGYPDIIPDHTHFISYLTSALKDCLHLDTISYLA